MKELLTQVSIIIYSYRHSLLSLTSIGSFIYIHGRGLNNYVDKRISDWSKEQHLFRAPLDHNYSPNNEYGDILVVPVVVYPAYKARSFQCSHDPLVCRAGQAGPSPADRRSAPVNSPRLPDDNVVCALLHYLARRRCGQATSNECYLLVRPLPNGKDDLTLFYPENRHHVSSLLFFYVAHFLKPFCHCEPEGKHWHVQNGQQKKIK